MIARVAGRLASLEGQTATLQLEGVGLACDVLLPGYLVAELAPRLGQRVELCTFCYLESQSQGASFIPRLVGFESVESRRFFELFQTVKGMGVKRSLRALARPPTHVAAAIAARDVESLRLLPEVGKRLAETIVAELHGKVEALAAQMVESTAGVHGPAAVEAIAALVALGESRADAEALVHAAISRSPALDTAASIVAAALAARR